MAKLSKQQNYTIEKFCNVHFDVLNTADFFQLNCASCNHVLFSCSKPIMENLNLTPEKVIGIAAYAHQCR